MVGRDVIIYILQHNLEDEPVFQNGLFIGFISASEVAAMLGVGNATIRAWHELGVIKGVEIGNTLYFLEDRVKKLKSLSEGRNGNG